MRGIASYANDHGRWHVFSAPEGEEYAIFSPGPYRWDGLIVRPAGAAFMRRVLSLKVPVVSVGSLVAPSGVPRVKVNDHENTALVLRHLLACGLKRFAYCSFFPALKMEDRGPAFIANVRALGCTCESFNQRARVRPDDSWMQRLRQLTQWLRQLPKPVGIGCYTPDVACQVVDACNRAGLRVPDDVAVIAMDDDPMKCGLAKPTVSAAQIPATRIGHEAARLLDVLLGRRQAPATVVEIAPTGVIVKRQSTAIVGAADRDIHQAAEKIAMRSHQPFSTERLAEEMHVSSRWLQRHFRRVLGCSPREHHRKARVEHAQRLLLETDWPAARIAAKTGFHCPSHLNRAIREKTGETPLAFRARFRL